MVPQALNYFDLVFGVVIGVVSLGDIGRKIREVFEDQGMPDIYPVL
jgi:hypothetical protein